jgi:hypothetical protein
MVPTVSVTAQLKTENLYITLDTDDHCCLVHKPYPLATIPKTGTKNNVEPKIYPLLTIPKTGTENSVEPKMYSLHTIAKTGTKNSVEPKNEAVLFTTKFWYNFTLHNWQKLHTTNDEPLGLEL